ncbi:MAG: hypothetical protein BGP13_16880 [Sphingobacteriales bacterium 40-81]|nr:MAG: hypothetical protein BGP13_16880 [Sphingobacteriales bacterium 40-81]
MLYNTSQKAKLSVKGSFEKWLQQNKHIAKPLGILLIVLSFILLPLKDGFGVGTFTAFLLLMAAACLIIMIAPFHYIRFKHIAALVMVSFLLEFLFS